MKLYVMSQPGEKYFTKSGWKFKIQPLDGESLEVVLQEGNILFEKKMKKSICILCIDKTGYITSNI